MSLSKNATKLLQWLVRYNTTASELVSRIPIFKQRGPIIKGALTELLASGSGSSGEALPGIVLTSYFGDDIAGDINVTVNNLYLGSVYVWKYDEIEEYYPDPVIYELVSNGNYPGGAGSNQITIDDNVFFNESTPLWPLDGPGTYRFRIAGHGLDEEITDPEGQTYFSNIVTVVIE